MTVCGKEHRNNNESRIAVCGDVDDGFTQQCADCVQADADAMARHNTANLDYHTAHGYKQRRPRA